VNDFALRVNELHFLECLVKRHRIHFASFQTNHTAKFLPGYQIGSGNPKTRAGDALERRRGTAAVAVVAPGIAGVY
jgi:hypothetical protein